MRMINTNLLNYFYKKGVKTLKEAVANKLDSSKIVNNLLTTEAGFALDARQGAALQGQLDAISSNLSEVIVFSTINTVATIKQGTQTVNITLPSNANYTWHRIETAASGFVTVMNGTDKVLCVESNIATPISITFVNTFIGVKKL